jgi:hypothetical protein
MLQVLKMVIKRKDGSIYRLTHPNPVMLKQAFWEDDSLVHNFQPEEVVTKEASEEEYEEPKQEIVKEEEIPLQDMETEEIHVPVKAVDPKEIPDLPKSKRIVPKAVPREIVHVLPAVIHETYDSLYGETRTTVRYMPKYTMEVVVASSDDLSATFWTNSEAPGKGSVIYFPREIRWWKVQQTSGKADGTLLHCVPSDMQPSFE